MVEKNDLTALDLRVLEVLTQSTRSTGTVRLASDMWIGDDWTMGADPVGLVQHLVEYLCQLGLLKYNEKPLPSTPPSLWTEEAPPSYSGLAFDIRLTQAGWALMGYPNILPEVGRKLATMIRLDPHGDRTNFRKHNHHAEGGPIETDDFPTHRAKYPQHLHMYEDNDMPRTYTKVTDELEGTVIAYRTRFPLADYQTIADETGIPKRTVTYILSELPKLRHMNDIDTGSQTQKARILAALEQLDVKDVPNLIKALGRGDSAHDIVHALHDLKKQGMVEFDERGTSTKEPKNIRMSARARKSANLAPIERRVIVGESFEEQDARLKEVLAEQEFTEQDAANGTDPLSIERFPLLKAIIDREQDRLRFDQKAMRYLEAADLIRETDAETAALLDQKAQESDIPFPNPLEAEYLLFWRRASPLTIRARD